MRSRSWGDEDERVATNRGGACTNAAEEYFSRLRRAEIGHHHSVADAYLLRYAQEASWREDYRRMSSGEQMERLAVLVTKKMASPDFAGYWQRHVAAWLAGATQSDYICKMNLRGRNPRMIRKDDTLRREPIGYTKAECLSS